MAVMFPAEWSDRNHSSAERLIWHRLRDQTPDDWFAIHSLGLTSHTTKPWAEADFVIVCGDGVIVLEVKGGRISVDHGRWTTNGNPLKESPFSQAGGAAAALHGDLRGRFPALKRAVVGWGVILPDVTFEQEGPDILSEVVYDDRDLAEPMERYIARVGDHWRRFHGREGDSFRPLSRSERAAIVGYLAPTFDLAPTLRALVAHAEEDLARLTSDQARVMRGLRTKERVIVRGGAGTGKTMLAVEEAGRLAATGHRTLLCCRSPLLAARLATAVADEVRVESAGELMRRLLDESGLTRELPDAEEADLRDVFIPRKACEAAIELGVAGQTQALVIDEGQDLLTEGDLEFFDTMLDRGLAAGTWRVFIDHRQNLFSAVDLAQLHRMEDLCVSDFDLTANCRNTPEIAVLTYMLAAMTPDEVLADRGPEVDLRWVTDSAEAVDTAALLASTWTRRGVEPQDIVVLTPDERHLPRLRRSFTAKGQTLSNLEDAARDDVRWCSIDDFKGLESRAVIVLGIDELRTSEARRRTYVGLSRARVLLGLVLDIDVKPDFELRAAEFARLQFADEGRAGDSVPAPAP